jgi:DNA-binding transcriptional MerR regulator
MFKIGDFSKICQVPASALRYYADIGLFEPIYTDKFTGYRYYSLDQLPRLNRILALKDLGLSLPDIAKWVDENISVVEIERMLRLKEAELEQEIRETQERLSRVRARLRQLQQDNSASGPEIVLKSLEPYPVLSLREVIAEPDHVAHLFRETSGILREKGVQLTGAPLTIFHDAEFKEADMDVEIAYPVEKNAKHKLPLRNERYLTVRELDYVKSAACTLHIGSYDHFAETYALLGRWLDENDYDVAGQPREIYLQPAGLAEVTLTEIQMPVQRR